MASPGTPDTVPDSPTSIAQDYDNDFARLTPSNDAAQLAFHAVAEVLNTDASLMPHARKFVYVYPDPAPRSPEINTETDSSEPATRELLQHGYYRFNLDILPKNLSKGWYIGRGHEDEHGEEGVDIRLLITNGASVARKHAMISYDFKTNILALVAPKGRKVVVNGKHVLNGSQRVLGDFVSSIDIGTLRYRFEYTIQGHGAYRHRLDELREELGLPYSVMVPDILSPTPSPHDYEFHDYFIKLAFEAGSTCTVLTGVHNTTGTLVAIKRMTRSHENADHIAHEIAILHDIQKHKPHSSICRLVDDIVTGGTRRERAVDRRIDEAYLIYQPLAVNTFVHLIRSGVEMPQRLLFSKQILEGIAYLHSIGLMHRDIKPANLMVVSYEPPKAMITDFGHAKFGNSSQDHYKGTLSYLAPETWDLKDNRSHTPYDNKIDVWAYAVSSYELFCWRPLWWGNEITLAISLEMRTHLEQMKNPHLTSDLKLVLRQMLARDPRARISAADALATDALRYIGVPEAGSSPISEPDGEQKRRRL